MATSMASRVVWASSTRSSSNMGVALEIVMPSRIIGNQPAGLERILHGFKRVARRDKGRQSGLTVNLPPLRSAAARTRAALILCSLLWALASPATSAVAAVQQTPSRPRGDLVLGQVFADETSALSGRCLGQVQTADDWERLRRLFRRQLFEMLGLDPLPARGALQATVTGVTECDDLVVEKLHFQSSPGLYVTANLYRPKPLTAPAPAILYLCGHGP